MHQPVCVKFYVLSGFIVKHIRDVSHSVSRELSLEIAADKYGQTMDFGFDKSLNSYNYVLFCLGFESCLHEGGKIQDLRGSTAQYICSHTDP